MRIGTPSRRVLPLRPVLVSCESLDRFGRKIEAMADGGRRQGDRYILTKEEISRFHSDGYVHLKVHPKILSIFCDLVRSARKGFWMYAEILHSMC